MSKTERNGRTPKGISVTSTIGEVIGRLSVLEINEGDLLVLRVSGRSMQEVDKAIGVMSEVKAKLGLKRLAVLVLPVDYDIEKIPLKDAKKILEIIEEPKT